MLNSFELTVIKSALVQHNNPLMNNERLINKIDYMISEAEKEESRIKFTSDSTTWNGGSYVVE